jgi:hypothetical protein
MRLTVIGCVLYSTGILDGAFVGVYQCTFSRPSGQHRAVESEMTGVMVDNMASMSHGSLSDKSTLQGL